MVLFDTDILIWTQRGNAKAAALIEKHFERGISIQTYMELLQCAKNKLQQKYVQDFLKNYEFTVLNINEKISYRAAIYIEEYALSHGLQAADSIIAATAIENNLCLHSSNKKHYHFIPNLNFKAFKP